MVHGAAPTKVMEYSAADDQQRRREGGAVEERADKTQVRRGGRKGGERTLEGLGLPGTGCGWLREATTQPEWLLQPLHPHLHAQSGHANARGPGG